MKTALSYAVVMAFVLVSAPPIFATDCATDDPTGASVAAARASADQSCHDDGRGCDNAPSHGAYVSCVAHAVNALSSGPSPSLPRSCKGAVKRCAARSTCGKQDRGFVTCYRTDSSGTTKCSIKAESSLCTAPSGGSACVGSNASCCDSCTP